MGLDQATLANRVGLHRATLTRMESGSGPIRGTYENVAAVQRELEAAGIEFLGEHGVSLRRPASGQAL